VARVGDVFRRAQAEGSGRTLRHTFAGHLHQNGANMRDIQVALDHHLISTTLVYLAFTPVGDLHG
jgi:site-specific recombinase XerD